MDMRPDARFGIAIALLIVSFLITSAPSFASTETAGPVVLAAGPLGARHALELSEMATFGVVAWGWLTRSIQFGSAELTFAGDGAVAGVPRRRGGPHRVHGPLPREIKANSHG